VYIPVFSTLSLLLLLLLLFVSILGIRGMARYPFVICCCVSIGHSCCLGMSIQPAEHCNLWTSLIVSWIHVNGPYDRLTWLDFLTTANDQQRTSELNLVTVEGKQGSTCGVACDRHIRHIGEARRRNVCACDWHIDRSPSPEHSAPNWQGCSELLWRAEAHCRIEGLSCG
jgi:hypothetical protein